MKNKYQPERTKKWIGRKSIQKKKTKKKGYKEKERKVRLLFMPAVCSHSFTYGYVQLGLCSKHDDSAGSN
jgi:hypothetical protein